MNLISYRDKWATKMGLPLSARYKHAKDDVHAVALDVHSQHPEHSWEECWGRAEARLDGMEHQRSLSKSFFVTKSHNYRRWVEIGIIVFLLITCLMLAKKAHAQNITVKGAAKGTTSSNTATVTANDANHNGLDVNVLNAGSGGTASSFGAAFPATGTAAGFSDGVNMLPGTLDASGFLKINCAAGCVAGGSFADSTPFTFGTTTVSNTAFVVDDVATNTVAENSSGAARMNTNRILYMDISKTAANTIAIKVDGSAVTQPVSLTSTTITGTVGVTQSTSPWVISFTAPQHVIVDSGTTTVTQATGTNLHVVVDTAPTTAVTIATAPVLVAGSAIIGKVGIDQTTPGTTNAVAVTNLPTTVDTNSGVKSASTLRVVLATDQPALTNKLLVTPDSVALPANQSVNVSQINAVTPLMGNGVTGTGSQRVTIASDNTAFSVNSSDVGTLADNGAAAATNRVATLPGIVQTSYNNGTASTQGRNAALNVGTDGLLWTANLPAIRPASYVASSAFAGSSTTDNAVMPGNASNTVLVTMVKVSCTQTTAGSITLTLLKRSTADTVGTSAAMTAVPDDSNYSAAVSAPLSYTGTGPTVGTPVGNVDNVKLGCEATTTAAPQDIYILNRRQKPIVLRGTAQQLAVNAGGAITGGNITVTFEWLEVATILP
jgi:hypothetical protein